MANVDLTTLVVTEVTDLVAGSSRQLGAFGESYAAAWLTRHGYEVLERNVRYPVGEIDIIAHEAGESCLSKSRSHGIAIRDARGWLSFEQMRHLEAAIETTLLPDNQKQS